MLPTLLSLAHLEACFAADYAGAHARFRHACDRHEHSRYREFVYKQKGPNNEKLMTATGWFGPLSAAKVLVIQSAVHGVEGFCGSAIQIDFLDYFFKSKLPDDVAVLLIHALNPYGFAWLRRVNEDGVDLNRNFVDFQKPLPVNTGYAELAEYIVPGSEDGVVEADLLLETKKRLMGQQAFELAVSGGQYAFSDGLFYGGLAASYSRLYLEEIMAEFGMVQRDKVAVLDIHTGLGAFAYGELICDHPPGSESVAWAREVYGQSVTEPALGTSSSVPKLGLVDYSWQDLLGDRVCFITLEFGTYSVDNMLKVLRADHMLHRKEFNWTSQQANKIKNAIKGHFYPASADWQELVLLRGRQVVLQALMGLSKVA